MRLTDNDQSFGPFVYGKSKFGGLNFSVQFGTGDDGESSFDHNYISAYIASHCFMLKLPRILKPHQKFVEYKDSGYWKIEPREWGISFLEDVVILRYGRQSNDSVDDKVKTVSIPWLQWTWVRKTVWDGDGNLVYIDQGNTKQKTLASLSFDDSLRMKEKTCKKQRFRVRDYDGTQLEASVYVCEMEWHRGRGTFSWLKWFTKPMIRKYIEIEWHGERGPGKEDWKGGIIIESFDMLPNETIQEAFVRFCDATTLAASAPHRSKHDAPLVFLGSAF